MFYTPLNYEQINVSAGTYTPSTVKAFNNETFAFWERALFQRACSVLKFNVPDDWKGNVKDFLLYCLFKFGYVAIFENNKFGLCFQPCTLNGYNFYYQPKEVIISNPLYTDTLEIGDVDGNERISISDVAYLHLFDLGRIKKMCNSKNSCIRSLLFS